MVVILVGVLFTKIFIPFSIVVFCGNNICNACESNGYGQQVSVVQTKGELTAFFRLLFRNSAFPYSLFGDKPISFYDYPSKSLPNFFLIPDWYLYFPRKYHLLCEKYKSYLVSDNFLILDQPFHSKKFPTSGYVHDILVLNRIAFIQTVNQHITIFHRQLKNNLTANQLWEKCTSNPSILCDILQEDELLWGILLGYGKHNAQLYTQNDPALTEFDRNYFLELIPLPGFHADPCHTETESLHKKYRALQKQLTEIYNRDDFLEVILKKIGTTQNQPQI